MSATDNTLSFSIEGDEITIPVEVRSARMIAVQYLVDAGLAQGVIDYSGLQVALLRGKAVLALSAVQYLDNDLGPYNEIAIAFGVHPHDAAPGAKPSLSRPTTFIHKLPVNQAFTCAAGRGIWGFPKWITSISYAERANGTEAVLIDGGEFALGVSVRHSPVPLPSREMVMTWYSWCDGVLRRTPWTTRNKFVHARPGGATVALGSSSGIASELRSLGLPKRALMSMTAGLMTATFGAPETVEI